MHSDHVLYQTALLILLRLSANLPMLAGLPLMPIRYALLEWFRAAELSCDRAAALLTRDPQAVCRTLMVLSAGAAAEHSTSTRGTTRAGRSGSAPAAAPPPAPAASPKSASGSAARSGRARGRGARAPPRGRARRAGRPRRAAHELGVQHHDRLARRRTSWRPRTGTGSGRGRAPREVERVEDLPRCSTQMCGSCSWPGGRTRPARPRAARARSRARSACARPGRGREPAAEPRSAARSQDAGRPWGRSPPAC